VSASQSTVAEQIPPVLLSEEHLRKMQAEMLRKRIRCSDTIAHELALLIYGENRS
jgi:hypothetical protein